MAYSGILTKLARMLFRFRNIPELSALGSWDRWNSLRSHHITNGLYLAVSIFCVLSSFSELTPEDTIMGSWQTPKNLLDCRSWASATLPSRIESFGEADTIIRIIRCRIYHRSGMYRSPNLRLQWGDCKLFCSRAKKARSSTFPLVWLVIIEYSAIRSHASFVICANFRRTIKIG